MRAVRHCKWGPLRLELKRLVKFVAWLTMDTQKNCRIQSLHLNGEDGEHSPDKWVGHKAEVARETPQRLRLGLDFRSSMMDVPEVSMISEEIVKDSHKRKASEKYTCVLPEEW